MTNQTKLCLTKHCHPHSGSWRKGMTGKGVKRWGWLVSKREREKSKKAHKSSRHLFNFHNHRDFYKLLLQTRERGQEEWGPQGPTSRCSIFACPGHNVITGGTGLLQRWSDSKSAQRKKHVCDTSGKYMWWHHIKAVLKATNEEVGSRVWLNTQLIL